MSYFAVMVGQDLPAQVRTYSNRLEDATGYTVAGKYDSREGAFCWYLVDTCGDIEGDGWHSFQDLKLDTVDTVESYEQASGGTDGQIYQAAWATACEGLS